jgi:hypothetical protein
LPAHRRALLLQHLPQLTAFYDQWVEVIEQGSSIYVTDALLDLELSGWRLINKDPSRYKRRFRRSRLPRGDLLQDHDSGKSRKAKNRLIQALDKKCRINPLLKKQAKGLRRLLESQLLARPIWRKSLKTEGLSLIDRDLVVNSLAAASVDRSAVLTNDKALSRMLKSLRMYLKSPSWAGEAFKEQALLLAQLELELCTLTTENGQLLFSDEA